nr:hypothetical protein [Klebsiella pneumoniae subsp. pneumoniae]
MVVDLAVNGQRMGFSALYSGWAPALTSTIDRRSCARIALSLAYTPDQSGPRWRIRRESSSAFYAARLRQF